MARGRLEALLTANQAWTATITTTAGGPTLVTALASAATSYPTDLLAAFKVALDAAAIGTWTVTGSFGESGTGKVNITCNQATYTLAWTSTSLRDALGFSASVTETGATQTGGSHCDGVWLPTCSMWSKVGPANAGNDISDTVQSVSPRGDVYTLTSQRRVENALTWSHVTTARTWVASESVTGESLQQFWRDCYLGESTWCTAGTKIRVIWDADVSATYTEYRIAGWNTFDPPRSDENWAGMYRVEIPRLVKVPA
jgi:hypothetical protein